MNDVNNMPAHFLYIAILASLCMFSIDGHARSLNSDTTHIVTCTFQLVISAGSILFGQRNRVVFGLANNSGVSNQPATKQRCWPCTLQVESDARNMVKSKALWNMSSGFDLNTSSGFLFLKFQIYSKRRWIQIWCLLKWVSHLYFKSIDVTPINPY